MISRLEEAVERAIDGGGITWNNTSGFLSRAKSPEEILSLIQVNILDMDAIALTRLVILANVRKRLVPTA